MKASARRTISRRWPTGSRPEFAATSIRHTGVSSSRQTSTHARTVRLARPCPCAAPRRAHARPRPEGAPRRGPGRPSGRSGRAGTCGGLPADVTGAAAGAGARAVPPAATSSPEPVPPPLGAGATAAIGVTGGPGIAAVAGAGGTSSVLSSSMSGLPSRNACSSASSARRSARLRAANQVRIWSGVCSSAQASSPSVASSSMSSTLPKALALASHAQSGMASACAESSSFRTRPSTAASASSSMLRSLAGVGGARSSIGHILKILAACPENVTYSKPSEASRPDGLLGSIAKRANAEGIAELLGRSPCPQKHPSAGVDSPEAGGTHGPQQPQQMPGSLLIHKACEK
eukprot:scaffold1098_cov118-Isochrysis_galbana.AAC.2